MAITQLSVTATPGRRYSFSAKLKGVGRFTELSTIAVPGRIHSFVAKSEALGHTGLFTELSVTATPGQRHSFSAKAAASTHHRIHRGIWDDTLIRDDEEILELVAQIVLSGILE